jgi:hypothetical protein
VLDKTANNIKNVKVGFGHDGASYISMILWPMELACYWWGSETDAEHADEMREEKM